jgi:hypothetical protein
MAGTLVANTINTDTGLFTTNNAYLGIAKAWVQYNGIAQTVTGSFNVSSVTYLATGRYQVNFTTAMANTGYAGCVTSSVDGTGGVSGAMKYACTEQSSTYLTTSCVIVTQNTGPSAVNTAIISAIFIGS